MEKLIEELFIITGVPKNVIIKFINERALPYFRFNISDCIYKDTFDMKNDESNFSSEYSEEYILPPNIIFIEKINSNGIGVKFNYNVNNNLLHILYPNSDTYEVNCFKCETDDIICNMVSFYNYCLSELQKMVTNWQKYTG